MLWASLTYNPASSLGTVIGPLYSYSGIRLDPLPWTELLSDLRSSVESASGESFNSVLLNYYRDHRDSLGFHSDDERELGPRPTIASLSLGEERTFILESKADKSLRPVRLKTHSGSLLVMKGDTQTNWKHAINKETRPCGPHQSDVPHTFTIDAQQTLQTPADHPRHNPSKNSAMRNLKP